MYNEKIQPTEHPHSVKIWGASGIWQAAIKGTYIRVWALIGCHKRGMDEMGNSQKLSDHNSRATARCVVVLS